MIRRFVFNALCLSVLIAVWSVVEDPAIRADQCCTSTPDCSAYGNDLTCCGEPQGGLNCILQGYGECLTDNCNGHACFERYHSCSVDSDCCFYPCNSLELCNNPTSCSSCDQSANCCSECGLAWNYDIGACDTSPILINLQSNSADFDLTSAEDGVLFDLTARGFVEQVAWTEPDSRIGFLALDRNGNGRIDDGSELFGTVTTKRDGSRAANGFDALADLDGEAGHSDGKIDASDRAYSQLRLWLDANHNGSSEVNELVTLESAGVKAVFTDYTVTKRRDRHGNSYTYKGRAVVVDRHGREVLRRIFDVFLVRLTT